MSKIKLWITDIDGTIINYDGSMTERMANLIKKINSSENKIVLATGRMFMGANYARKNFNISTPVVCFQGAVVRDENNILFQRPLQNSIAKDIIKYFKSKNIHTHVYSHSALFVEDDNKRIMQAYCKGRGTTYEVVCDFLKLNINEIPKILAVIEDEDLMKVVKQELSTKYEGVLNIVQSAKAY
ncbi:HAD-IIB family hydrolase, partial [bacterium]|nr:HAD-IIB family hydrolase [bacterium]